MDCSFTPPTFQLTPFFGSVLKKSHLGLFVVILHPLFFPRRRTSVSRSRVPEPPQSASASRVRTDNSPPCPPPAPASPALAPDVSQVAAVESWKCPSRRQHGYNGRRQENEDKGRPRRSWVRFETFHIPTDVLGFSFALGSPSGGQRQERNIASLPCSLFHQHFQEIKLPGIFPNVKSSHTRDT